MDDWDPLVAVDDAFAPDRVEIGEWFLRDGFLGRFSSGLQFLNVIARSDQHVPEFREVRFVSCSLVLSFDRVGSLACGVVSHPAASSMNATPVLNSSVLSHLSSAMRSLVIWISGTKQHPCLPARPQLPA
jgi:hypothetical protein